MTTLQRETFENSGSPFTSKDKEKFKNPLKIFNSIPQKGNTTWTQRSIG